MKLNRTRANRGFSLVELLAVVLILAVLAAVAVPLYINTRKTSAARACKANIAAIAAAESTYALRNGYYSIDLTAATTYSAANAKNSAVGTTLVGAPEGLSNELTCPEDPTKKYTICNAPDGTPAGIGDAKGKVYIHCTNDAVHVADLGGSTLADWNRPMAAVPTENTP
jgi:prepilin-type N-terminal cleavage/methylation domain-containing protein